MSALYRPRRLRDPRVVPTEPVEIDLSHPLAFDWGIIPGSVYGLQPIGCAATIMTPASSAYVLTPSSIGPAANGLTASSYLSAPAPSVVTDGTKGASLFFLSESHGIGANNPTLIGLGYDATMSNNTMVMAIFNNLSNGLVLAGSGWETNASSVFLPSNGRIASGTTWFDASTSPALYLDGIELATSSAGVAPAFTLGTAPTLFFNGDPNSSGRNTDQLAGAAYWYRRVLSADEHAWLAAEPFAMLRPRG